MPRFPYQFFDEFIVRTHLFSRKSFQKKVSKDEISDEDLKNIFTNPIFQEAIFLASPYLHKELNKWVNSEKIFSPKETEKLKYTLLKYYCRISTRCTPFGLFSGIGLGRFSNETYNQSNFGNNNLKPASIKVRDTRLDMHFLISLTQYFVKKKEIRNNLLFYPNNSIYRVGNKIRYIEYQNNNGKRDYIISSASLSDELQQVLQFLKNGKTIEQTAKALVSSQISIEEATDFIEELINNQLLTSELEPHVSGIDFLETIISVLSRVKATIEVKILRSIQSKLKDLDQVIGKPTLAYFEIEELIKSFKTEYEQKYLFQTDLYYTNEFLTTTRWKKELKQAFSFLNKLTIFNQDTHLSTFKKAFSERFESREVPLALALDTEIGVGYRQDIKAQGVHPYLEDLPLPYSHQKQNLTIHLTPVQKILNEKLQEALLDKQYVIELSDDDFKGFEENWHDLPDTISFMAEIVSEKRHEKLCIENGGGNTAANLLGRFCSEKSKVQDLTKTITQKEEDLNPDVILAEIVHLPDARVGNVIRRSTLRQYEIPYLAKSVLSKENQIYVDDLYISLQNNRLVLRSKRLNKEVKPYLTNAHNYYTNSLPVYNFLSDLYSQDIRTGLYFDWGDLSHIYQFFPRVEYKNCILSKARWRINQKDIVLLVNSINDKNQLLSSIANWRKKKQIPQWIQCVKSDNTLTLNLKNYDMVKLFLQTVNIEKTVIIEEYLYNENDDFKREFIFPMYKTEKQ